MPERSMPHVDGGAARVLPAAVPGRIGDVRRGNLALVVNAIEATPRGRVQNTAAVPVTRAQVAAATGLTKASVSSLVAELMNAGLVREVGLNRANERGRPGTGLELNGSLAVMGMEVNVDYIAVGLMDLAGKQHAQRMLERHNRGDAPGSVLNILKSLASDLRQEAGALGMTVLGGGLAVPGLVDSSSGTVVRAPNLGWTSTVLDLEGLLPGAPYGTRLHNEANSAALAELWYGQGTGMRDYLFVSGEVGVGGGLVLNSELFTGPGGHAGELGHVVVDPGGPPCSCGGHGCLETFAGQEAVFAEAGIGGESTSGRIHRLLGALSEGDKRATAAVERAGHHLGIAVVSTVRLMSLSEVVLGGSFSLLADWIRPSLLGALAEHAPGAVNPADVVVSTLGQSAALLGAAGSCIRGILEEPHDFMSRVTL